MSFGEKNQQDQEVIEDMQVMINEALHLQT